MSPYLQDKRLQEVVAAITAMGTYKFYKLDFEGWADRISGSAERAAHWRQVFLDHPEFFRLDSKQQKASLVWRRQYPRSFDVDAETEVSADHHQAGVAYERISRRPLEPSEITSLIGVAIQLHSAAAERARDKRWWVWAGPAALGFLGAAIGGYL